MCMEEHEVYTVKEQDSVDFKGREIIYDGIYEYCDHADELMESEDQIKSNKLSMIDKYRSEIGLLTSSELINIRERYGVSQKDFSEILDWGKATITRYENHQVQDRAHDDILRMVDEDPKWFLEKLESAQGRISQKAFKKYLDNTKFIYFSNKDKYLIESIEASYIEFKDHALTGNMELDLSIVVEVVNYLAQKVERLHKVKLMKMLWYSDNLFYKRYGKAMTGMVYKALPMGAVPEGHDKIILLDGIIYDEVEYDNEYLAYKFKAIDNFRPHYLTEEMITVLDDVIENFGNLNAKEISDRMHKEEAYKCTESFKVISYEYAKELSLN